MKEPIHKISELIPDDKNFNKGSEYGNSMIEKSFRKFGAGRSILIDKNNRIIAGNKSIENATAIGLEDLQIVESDGKRIIAVKRIDIDLDTPQGREMALADNASAKANIILDAELIEAELGEAICQEWGVDVVKEATEDDYEIPDTIETDIVLGDLFEIGEHRLLCGDSTDSDQVAKLMNGQKADMVFTDPPYGVDIKGKFTGKILNDNLQGEDFDDFLNECFNNLFLFNKGNLYISYEIKNHTIFENALIKSGFIFDEIIIWNKDSASFYSKNKYNRKFEPIFFIENGKPLQCEPDVNVWDFAKSSSFASRDENNKRFNEVGNFLVAHPTTKPLALISKALNNSTKENQLTLDLFLGSGSTMVASHQLKRKCYGMELDPKYCQVIVDRMLKLDPTLVIKKNGKKYTK